MNYEVAMLRAAVGFKVARPGCPFVTGGGQDAKGKDLGLLVNDGGEYVAFKPSKADLAATDWAEVA